MCVCVCHTIHKNKHKRMRYRKQTDTGCAFRPPRVVFVLGLVSLINSLTSRKMFLFPARGAIINISDRGRRGLQMAGRSPAAPISHLSVCLFDSNILMHWLGGIIEAHARIYYCTPYMGTGGR